ncbi:MAG: hypothetical protein LBH54_04195 [Clostridiales bacterium]|nr:hypothetical protein [Clostridiales bacterium]
MGLQVEITRLHALAEKLSGLESDIRALTDNALNAANSVIARSNYTPYPPLKSACKRALISAFDAKTVAGKITGVLHRQSENLHLAANTSVRGDRLEPLNFNGGPGFPGMPGWGIQPNASGTPRATGNREGGSGFDAFGAVKNFFSGAAGVVGGAVGAVGANLFGVSGENAPGGEHGQTAVNLLKHFLPEWAGRGWDAVELATKDGGAGGRDFGNFAWGAVNGLIKSPAAAAATGGWSYIVGVFSEEARIAIDSYNENKDTTDYSFHGITSAIGYGFTHPKEFGDAICDGLDEMVSVIKFW